MGLVNRVVEPGTALDAAVELAESIAAFPQLCLRSDRRSAIDQWNLGDGAMGHEFELGTETLSSREVADGLARFAGGAGRGGRME
jgi:enoyl-CoA hydratase